MTANRVKVSIRCRKCGERYILKGRRDKDRIDTGFKQCVCNNEKDFDIETEEY
jgi:DNA-directed RNA polymerase subunit RPC12/RpoP